MANRVKVTPETKAKFITDVMNFGGNVTKAAEASGISRNEWYRTRAEDPEFHVEWDRAVVLGTESLIDEARRRAYEGVEEGVYHCGKRVDVVRKYSDTLLMFLIKGHRPEFRDNHRVELTGADGGPIETVDMTVDDAAKRLLFLINQAIAAGVTAPAELGDAK